MLSIPQEGWAAPHGMTGTISGLLDLFDDRSELREDLRDSLPHKLVINGEVDMCEFIPHAGYLPPWDLRVCTGKGFREHLDGFADDQEIVGDCIHGFFIGKEGFTRRILTDSSRISSHSRFDKGHSFGKRIDPVKGTDNIFQEQAFVPHTYTTSCMTASRISLRRPPLETRSIFIPKLSSRYCQRPM